MVVATIRSVVGIAAAFPAFFGRELEPALRDAGADIVARLVTEHAPNNFPRLPVREGIEMFVGLSRFPDEAAQVRHSAQFDLRKP